jgi:hypothetical protein
LILIFIYRFRMESKCNFQDMFLTLIKSLKKKSLKKYYEKSHIDIIKDVKVRKVLTVNE